MQRWKKPFERHVCTIDTMNRILGAAFCTRGAIQRRHVYVTQNEAKQLSQSPPARPSVNSQVNMPRNSLELLVSLRNPNFSCAHMRSVTEMNLSGNKLRELPEEAQRLTSLK